MSRRRYRHCHASNGVCGTTIFISSWWHSFVCPCICSHMWCLSLKFSDIIDVKIKLMSIWKFRRFWVSRKIKMFLVCCLFDVRLVASFLTMNRGATDCILSTVRNALYVARKSCCPPTVSYPLKVLWQWLCFVQFAQFYWYMTCTCMTLAFAFLRLTIMLYTLYNYVTHCSYSILVSRQFVIITYRFKSDTFNWQKDELRIAGRLNGKSSFTIIVLVVFSWYKCIKLRV